MCGVTIWVSVGTNLDCYRVHWDMALNQGFPIDWCWWLCDRLFRHWTIYTILWTHVVSGNFYCSLEVTDSPLAQPLRQTDKPPVCKGTVKKPSAVLLVQITQKVYWYCGVADNMLTQFKKTTKKTLMALSVAFSEILRLQWYIWVIVLLLNPTPISTEADCCRMQNLNVIGTA